MKLAIFTFVSFVTLLVISISIQVKNDYRYNNWANKCYNDGGYVVNTGKGIITKRYECLKDGKFINQIK